MLLALFLLPLAWPSSDASACSCMAGPTTDQGVREMLSEPGWDDWVMFVGLVDSRQGQPVPNVTTVGVTVERVYRGLVPRRVLVRDTDNGGSCGHNPESRAREFIIAKQTDDGMYEATICGTVPFGAGQAQFFDALDRVSRGYPPIRGEGGGGALWPAFAFVATATAAGALALALGYGRGRSAPAA